MANQHNAQVPNATKNESTFWKGLTFNGFVQLTVIVIGVLALLFLTFDNPLNRIRVANEGENIKAKATVAVAEEKTKQMQILASLGAVPADASIVVVPQKKETTTSSASPQRTTCRNLSTKYGAFSVSKGGCITLDNSSGKMESETYLTSVGATTPIYLVSGGEFTLYTANKERESCSSSESPDRCQEWLKTHQEQGENGLYWYLFKVPRGEKISVNTL